MSSSTGTGASAATSSSATASPWPLTTAGWMPRAISRNSVERRGDLPARPVDPLARLGVAAEVAAEHAELERERDEPLLRAVVEIALQAAALVVPRLDDPLARAAQLLEPRPQLHVQARVLERDAGRGAHGAEELGLVVERRVVQQDRDLRPVVALDRRDRAAVVRAGERDRMALGVGVAAVLGQPVGERERRIAQRPRHRVAQLARRRVARAVP